MSKIQNVFSTGKTHTTSAVPGGIARSPEAKLNINMSAPGTGAADALTLNAVDAHPTAEKMFAGAWSGCLMAITGVVAKSKKLVLPPETAVGVEVDMGITGSEFFLQARITLLAPGIDQKVADDLLHAVDQMCPYSKSTRGNIDVVLKAVTA
ncbi:OsmC family protein [Rugamonas sp.]|uniref:OsmC family protein n=1 Tax=Rugamonas sp. TaxID=1926287 RepID=UPI0025EABDAC|nr:OsmC family protein [Rugamonas sp.]